MEVVKRNTEMDVPFLYNPIPGINFLNLKYLLIFI